MHVPQVDKKYCSFALRDRGFEKCRICGCGVNVRASEKRGIDVIRCNLCGGVVDIKCCDKLGLGRFGFECSQIKRNLRPGAVELPKIVEKPKPSDVLGLIVGGENLGDDDRLTCVHIGSAR